jgi:hypothetical protein
VLLLGAIAAIGIAIVTGIQGCGNTDEFGRVAIPGEGAFDLDAGTYTVYYQEHVDLDENDSLDAPNGIRIAVRGLGGAPKPTLDLGGTGSQISVNDEVSVSIGKLKVDADGRYGMVVGENPRPADRPAITLGETFGKTAARGGRRIGLVLAATLALFVLLWLVGGRAKPASVPTASTSQASAPPPPRAAPPADHESRLRGLEQLGELYEKGALSKDELERLKRDLLA